MCVYERERERVGRHYGTRHLRCRISENRLQVQLNGIWIMFPLIDRNVLPDGAIKVCTWDGDLGKLNILNPQWEKDYI